MQSLQHSVGRVCGDAAAAAAAADDQGINGSPQRVRGEHCGDEEERQLEEGNLPWTVGLSQPEEAEGALPLRRLPARWISVRTFLPICLSPRGLLTCLRSACLVWLFDFFGLIIIRVDLGAYLVS